MADSLPDIKLLDRCLATELALDQFVRDWERCLLPVGAWTHAAHIAVCAWYAYDRTASESYAAMREGVLRFNEAAGGKNTDTSGYHETLTRFWSFVIWRFVNASPFESRAQAVRKAVLLFAEDRSLPERVYGFNVRDSVECRRVWRAPSESFAAEMEGCERRRGESILGVDETNRAESLK
jgi:hypothetical protein